MPGLRHRETQILPFLDELRFLERSELKDGRAPCDQFTIQTLFVGVPSRVGGAHERDQVRS